MRIHPGVVAATLLFAAQVTAATPETATLDACRYPSVEVAQKVWTPIERGTPPIEAGSAGLRLPCNFATNRQWRVGWDRQETWNLSACRQIMLDVTAEGPLGEEMILYAHSGHGWYRQSFHAPPGRHTVRLPRRHFETEERPGDWSEIDRLRLCVLRGRAADRMLWVHGITAEMGRAVVAVYRNLAGVKVEESVPHFARLVGEWLDAMDVDYEVLGDEAVAAGGLHGKRVVILPLNPVLPAADAAALERFVAGGGKLLACYHLPKPLGRLLGVRVGPAVQGNNGRLHGLVFQDRADRPTLRVEQGSWIARTLRPAEGTRMVGHWADADGRETMPAVTRNTNGYFIGHVLTDRDPSGKRRLLLEMLAALDPGIAESLYARRLARLGRVAGFEGVDELVTAARAQAQPDPKRRKAVDALLKEAETLRKAADQNAKTGDLLSGHERLVEAEETLIRAFAVSVPSRPGEFRAVWCHSPTGVPGMSWDEAMAVLQRNGFNAILVNMCWGGSAAYPSHVLARADVPSDPLADCLAAGKRHGIAVHVWKVNWRLWGNGPAGLRETMAKAGRLQQDPSGRTLSWLCPSQEVNQRQELAAMLELARNPDVAGIHFDYIRYPNGNACYCPRCRKRFEEQAGKVIADWPAAVRPGGKLEAAYQQFRRNQITRLVAAVSQQARAIRPDIRISAAVFWDWNAARDDVGQDWRLWTQRGYLDFVCPMQYTRRAAAFESRTRATLGWADGRVPVMPGIGATLGLSPDGTLQQVLITRRLGAAGFVLFNLDSDLARRHLPLLGAGPTSAPSRFAWRRAPPAAWPPGVAG